MKIVKTAISLLSLLGGMHASAEMFVTNSLGDQILVYNNGDAGIGVAPKRVIEGGSTLLDKPVSIYVYTAAASGSPSEIFVCNSNSGQITVYPIDAEGDAAPTRTLLMAETPCDDLVVYQDELFTGDEDGIFAYPYDQDGLALDASRSITFGPDFSEIRSLDARNGELFALIAVDNAEEEQIWVFDIDASGVADDIVKRKLTNDPAISFAFSMAVTDDEIYVGSDNPQFAPPNQDPETIIVVYDIDINGASLPIRTLNEPNISIYGISVTDGSLYITDQAQDSILVFDSRSGGSVEAKRAIATAGGNDPLTSPSDVFVTPDADPVDAVFELLLEEPINGETHSGVGNLRGWSVASDGIEKVELYIDGVFYQDAPYGGVRGDVGGAYPTVNNGLYSGFSLAYNYSALDTGEHTIMARAHTKSGRVRESSSTFEVTKPGQEFIVDPNGVDVSGAACSINDQNIILKNISIDGGGPWDAIMKWRRAEQGFEVEQYIFDNNSI